MDIFIRSWRNDFHWLKYCIDSINKNAKGFGKLHIVIPVNDLELLPKFDAEVHVVSDWEDGYLQQQSDKLYSDMYCRNRYILCLDSDCIVTEELKPEYLFVNHKPIWLYEGLNRGQSPWPMITEEVLGFDPIYEFMRRHPFVFDRECLIEFRRFMFNKYNQALHLTIKQRPFHSFSEFNAYGAWCYKYSKMSYSWCTPDMVPVYVKQYRSWDGLSDDIRKEIEAML
jgi:hypothetical protein